MVAPNQAPPQGPPPGPGPSPGAPDPFVERDVTLHSEAELSHTYARMARELAGRVGLDVAALGAEAVVARMRGEIVRRVGSFCRLRVSLTPDE